MGFGTDWKPGWLWIQLFLRLRTFPRCCGSCLAWLWLWGYLFFCALHGLSGCSILKLENKDTFLNCPQEIKFSRTEEKYKSYIFLLSPFIECQQRMSYRLPQSQETGMLKYLAVRWASPLVRHSAVYQCQGGFWQGHQRMFCSQGMQWLSYLLWLWFRRPPGGYFDSGVDKWLMWKTVFNKR